MFWITFITHAVYLKENTELIFHLYTNVFHLLNKMVIKSCNTDKFQEWKTNYFLIFQLFIYLLYEPYPPF